VLVFGFKFGFEFGFGLALGLCFVLGLDFWEKKLLKNANNVERLSRTIAGQPLVLLRLAHERVDGGELDQAQEDEEHARAEPHVDGLCVRHLGQAEPEPIALKQFSKFPTRVPI
jgi:hypothetical protein